MPPLKELRKRDGNGHAVQYGPSSEENDDDDEDEDKGGGEKRKAKEIVKVVKLPKVLIEHHSSRKLGSGVSYINDDGEKVKIAKNGMKYRVAEDGRRMFREPARPRDPSIPEAWQSSP